MENASRIRYILEKRDENLVVDFLWKEANLCGLVWILKHTWRTCSWPCSRASMNRNVEGWIGILWLVIFLVSWLWYISCCIDSLRKLILGVFPIVGFPRLISYVPCLSSHSWFYCHCWCHMYNVINDVINFKNVQKHQCKKNQKKLLVKKTM